ncbi:MAG: DUF1232 domain-containing protein [Proteobacteria bacterium]|nr:DUF1232 domain-containing protein [Pseudomonadota bacterium]
MVTIEKIGRWVRELKSQVLTVWFSSTHRDTPLTPKLLAIVVAAYAFSPIDLIPDFIPVLGYLDDLILVPLGIYLVLRLLPANVIADSRKRADAWLAEDSDKPRNYWAAAFVVLVWAALIVWGWTNLAE